MARKLFERQAIRRRTGALAAGIAMVVYTDAAGTVLADISTSSGGAAIPGSTVTSADIAGLGPAALRFWGPPDGTDTLYIRVPADTSLGVQEIEASTDERLDALEAGSASGIPGTIVDAKGDLIAASGSDTPARLAVGATGTGLVADSSQTAGLKWVPVTVNVKNPPFNAVGNGVADDTAAFHAARDAAGVGGEVIVPAGTYLCGVITLNVAGQTWRLAQGATVKLAPGAAAGGAVFLVASSTPGVSIIGGTADGNGANQSNGSYTIRVGISSDVLIEGVTVINGKGYGIAGFGCNRLTVRNCKVSGSLTDGPIFIRPDSLGAADIVGAVVEGCLVDQSAVSAATVAGAGIKLIGYNGGAQVNDSRVSGNRVVMPASPAGNAIAIEANFSPRVVVSGNTTYGGNMGISVVACDRGVIDGNTVKAASGYGIEAGCAAGTVSGNTVDMTNLASTVGIQGVSNGSDCAISGNTVVNVATGIKTQSCLRTAITSNLVRASTGALVSLSEGDGSTIVGNILDGGGTCNIGVSLDKTSDVVIAENTIRNTDVSGIELFSDDSGYVIQYITITGNIFRSVGTVLVQSISGGASVGTTVRVTGNPGQPDYFDLASNVQYRHGTGSPESVVTAGVASLFLRTDGGAGTTIYTKETGTGNTGWKARSAFGAISTSGTIAFTGSTNLYGFDATTLRTDGNLQAADMRSDFHIVVDRTNGGGKLFLSGTFDTNLYRSAADVLGTDDDFAVLTAGKGLRVKEGSNAKMGAATLVAGAATVATTAVTANSRIQLTSQVDGGTPGFLRVSTRTAGTSFVITSSNGADTSVVAWFIVEPA